MQMNKPAVPKMWTLQELAQAARVTQRTSYRWIVDGKLPSAVKVSGKWLIPEAAALSILAGKGDIAKLNPPVVKSVQAGSAVLSVLAPMLTKPSNKSKGRRR
jgi:hypothetical protein